MSDGDSHCPIVGTWELEGYEITSRAARQAGRPRWSRSRGQLLYTTGGYMSVHLSNGEQRPFTAHRRWDGTAEEKVRAHDDYLGYGGTFRWEGDRVIHVIEHCTFPNWVGTEQVRMAHLDGDRLVLTDHRARADASVVLSWRRRAD